MRERTGKRPRIKRKVLVASSRGNVNNLVCTSVQSVVYLCNESLNNNVNTSENKSTKSSNTNE
jgi:hypothetical protein